PHQLVDRVLLVALGRQIRLELKSPSRTGLCSPIGLGPGNQWGRRDSLARAWPRTHDAGVTGGDTAGGALVEGREDGPDAASRNEAVRERTCSAVSWLFGPEKLSWILRTESAETRRSTTAFRKSA